MLQPAQDYNQIVQLFEKYMEHKKTRVLTIPGFWRFLLVVHQMPAWLVRTLKRQVALDPNLSFHLNTVVEDFILTGTLIGTLKESSAKLVLKNHFDYQESPALEDHHNESKIKQISYRPATLEDLPNAG